jgi:hypothetical protein
VRSPASSSTAPLDVTAAREVPAEPRGWSVRLSKPSSLAADAQEAIGSVPAMTARLHLRIRPMSAVFR